MRFPPRFEAAPDLQYFYHGTLAVAWAAPASLDRWTDGFFEAVRERQRKEPPDLAGSWNPIADFGPEAGRVASTALLTLCLLAQGHPPLEVIDTK